MRHLLFLPFATLIFYSGFSWSAPNKEYRCTLTLVAKDLPDGVAEAKFERPMVAPGTHGGDTLEFTFGTHKILTQVDGRWRTLRWIQADRVLGTVATVAATPYGSGFVLIMINPENDNDQLSLDCTFEP